MHWVWARTRTYSCKPLSEVPQSPRQNSWLRASVLIVDTHCDTRKYCCDDSATHNHRYIIYGIISYNNFRINIVYYIRQVIINNQMADKARLVVFLLPAVLCSPLSPLSACSALLFQKLLLVASPHWLVHTYLRYLKKEYPLTTLYTDIHVEL